MPQPTNDTCSHIWDKEMGVRTKSKPWIGLKSHLERTCVKCKTVQRYDGGKYGFHGWFTSPDSPDYSKFYATNQ